MNEGVTRSDFIRLDGVTWWIERFEDGGDRAVLRSITDGERRVVESSVLPMENGR